MCLWNHTHGRVLYYVWTFIHKRAVFVLMSEKKCLQNSSVNECTWINLEYCLCFFILGQLVGISVDQRIHMRVLATPSLIFTMKNLYWSVVVLNWYSHYWYMNLVWQQMLHLQFCMCFIMLQQLQNPSGEIMFSPVLVCLSVCLSACCQHYSKEY